MKRRPSAWPGVLACGAFAWLAGSILTPSMGAVRSVKLKWEQRRGEAEGAVAGKVETKDLQQRSVHHGRAEQ